MRSYLNIINEAIPLSQAKPFVASSNSSIYDELFSRLSKYSLNNNSNRLYFPLKRTGTYNPESFANAVKLVNEFNSIYSGMNFVHTYSDYAVPEKLLTALGTAKFDPESKDDVDLYLKGLINTLNGPQRIGKILEAAIKFYSKLRLALIQNPALKDELQRRVGIDIPTMIPELQDEIVHARRNFDTDRVRADMNGESFYVVISRHPYDIAGMSTGRGWTSCTDLTDGSERHYVMSYVKNGHLIAYLIKAGDWNIESPMSRRMIVRYEKIVDGIRDSKKFVLSPGDLYGSPSRSFTKFVNKFCRVINRGQDDGLYCNRSDDQYWQSRVKNRNDVTWDSSASRTE